MILPEFALHPAPADEAARAMTPTPGVDPVVGTRHRIGGQPLDWPSSEFPVCPGCGETMTFYGQLDSLPRLEFALADAGVILNFVCFDCFEVTASLQTG